MFHSGEPYTPYDISFIGQNDEDLKMFFYNTKMKNSGRLPAFNTLDFRLSKTWSFKKTQMNVYLNVVNVFNTENTTGYIYSAWQNSSGKWFVAEYSGSMNIPRFISPGLSFTF
jgi:hypothetical protein